MAGASVDDVLEEESTTSYKKGLNSEDPKERLLAVLSVDLSESQFFVYNNNVPFFKRISKSFNGMHIEYFVYSNEELSSYEEHADRLIEQGKIKTELVYINKGPDIAYLAFVCIEDGKCFVEIQEKAVNDILKEDAPEKIKVLRRLHEKKYSPDEVYTAIIKFIS